jgi:peptide methionine sulfoxide reductase MsrB
MRGRARPTGSSAAISMLLLLSASLRPTAQQQQQLVDTVFEHQRAATKPSGRCPRRPTYAECPLQPRMAGNGAERGLFSKICTPPLDRSVHAVSGAENPENRCHGVHSGEFTCGCCGHALFHASDKCESGTGWPSFSDSIGICIQEEYMDGDHGEHSGATAREAVCEHCGAHIGDWIVDDPGFVPGANLFGDEDEDPTTAFQPQCYNKVTGRAGRFCTDGICLVPPVEEGAELGYSSGWCTPPHQPRLPPPAAVRREACAGAADQRLTTGLGRDGESAVSALFGLSVTCFLQDHPPQPSDGRTCAPRTGLSPNCQQCFDALAQCAMVDTNCVYACLSGLVPGRPYASTPECSQCMRDAGCLALLDDCAGTTASIAVATVAEDDACAAGTDAINRACAIGALATGRTAMSGTGTAVAAGGGVPDMCTVECATAFMPWWDRCVATSVGLEVDRQLGVGELSRFYGACAAATNAQGSAAAAGAGAAPAGSGH